MSVNNENATSGESVVLERPAAGGVYASLFEKINLSPVSELSALDIWQDAQAMSDATADERLTAGRQVFLECLTKSGSKVEKLDKNLIDHHIAELDYQISRQLDAVMHHEAFQAVESLWRGVKSLVDKPELLFEVRAVKLSAILMHSLFCSGLPVPAPMVCCWAAESARSAPRSGCQY